eukprot:5318195-Prorocentrum_lima.AAC.1
MYHETDFDEYDDALSTDEAYAESDLYDDYDDGGYDVGFDDGENHYATPTDEVIDVDEFDDIYYANY